MLRHRQKPSLTQVPQRNRDPILEERHPVSALSFPHPRHPRPPTPPTQHRKAATIPRGQRRHSKHSRDSAEEPASGTPTTATTPAHTVRPQGAAQPTRAEERPAKAKRGRTAQPAQPAAAAENAAEQPAKHGHHASPHGATQRRSAAKRAARPTANGKPGRGQARDQEETTNGKGQGGRDGQTDWGSREPPYGAQRAQRAQREPPNCQTNYPHSRTPTRGHHQYNHKGTYQ